jgi:hypothetical protein
MSQNLFLKRDCPVCKNKGPYQTLIETPKKAENLTFKKLVNYWNGFFKEKIIFSYARCISCGLLFCPTFFTEKQLKKLYTQMAPNMDEVPEAALKNTQYGYFNILKKYSSLKGDYLEIGPDVGFFVEHTVKEGQFNRYWLFEPNRYVIPRLSRIVKDKKFKIIHAMTDFSALPNNSINAVVMIHVMDHMLDPLKMLKALKKKLKEDATMLIVTHDESSWLSKILNARWPAFCLQHPQIYNLKTTESLLKMSGFDVIYQQKTTNFFKLSFLVKHAFWAIGIKVNNIPEFGRMTLGLKLGNIATIATPTKSKN